MQVSVIIPTYNRYSLLKRAILSLDAQTLKVDEIIVVDDGSTDNTSQIQKDFPHIKYIYQKNKGVSSARNKGIKSVSNDWIAFLDSDDEWHEDKLKIQTEFYKSNPELLVSYTDELWIRGNKEVKVPKKFQKIGQDAFLENLHYCNIAPSSVMMHKKVFYDVGMFDESLEVCEDYDLWLRIALKYKISLIPQKLIVKHAGHDDQLGFKYWGMDRFRVKALEKLLDADTQKSAIIKDILVQKYTLLLKGAKKHDKIQDVYKYTKKIKEIQK